MKMTENEQIRQLVRRLTEKTRNNEITWSNSIPAGSFMTSFSRHSVKIGRPRINSSLGGKLPIALTVLNDAGEVIEETTGVPATLHPISSGDSANSVSWEELEHLYELVDQSRSVRIELKELLEELR